jgi:acetylornithine deacetylase
MGLLENALAAINQERLEQTLAELIQNPSVDGTSAEATIAEDLHQAWLADGLNSKFHELDLVKLRAHPEYPGEEVNRERAACVTATYGNDDGPHILLLGHTDVVPTGDLAAWHDNPFSGRIENRDGDRIMLGRGTCDMKAGLAAAWEAVRAVISVDGITKGRVTLASVCGEEDGGLGAFGLIQAGLKPDYCIIPEPTSLAIIPTNAGALTFRLTVTGKSLHASRKSEGVSAFEKFLPIYESLQKLEMDRNANPDAIFERWNYPFALSIGTIQAGDWSSSVPGKLVAEGRIGVRPDETVEQAKAIFEKKVSDMCLIDPWLNEHPILVEWPGGMFAPGNTELDSDVVTVVQEAHKKQFGSSPDIYGAPYGSDLRLLTKAGIPTIQYGPGDVTFAHSANEFVSLSETFGATQTFVRLLIAELN